MGEKLSGLNLWGAASQPSNFPASNIHSGIGSHKNRMNQIFSVEPQKQAPAGSKISILGYSDAGLSQTLGSHDISGQD